MERERAYAASPTASQAREMASLRAAHDDLEDRFAGRVRELEQALELARVDVAVAEGAEVMAARVAERQVVRAKADAAVARLTAVWEEVFGDLQEAADLFDAPLSERIPQSLWAGALSWLEDAATPLELRELAPAFREDLELLEEIGDAPEGKRAVLRLHTLRRIRRMLDDIGRRAVRLPNSATWETGYQEKLSEQTSRMLSLAEHAVDRAKTRDGLEREASAAKDTEFARRWKVRSAELSEDPILKRARKDGVGKRLATALEQRAQASIWRELGEDTRANSLDFRASFNERLHRERGISVSERLVDGYANAQAQRREDEEVERVEGSHG